MGVFPSEGAAVPLVKPERVLVPVLFAVYLIVSLVILPYARELVSVLVDSITIYPVVGNSAELVKIKLVAAAVISPFKVVFNSKVDTATPPTGSLTC